VGSREWEMTCSLIQQAEIDGNFVNISARWNGSGNIHIDLPHFESSAAYDPDFSVLLVGDSKMSPQQSQKSDPGISQLPEIIGITVGAVVFVAILIGAVGLAIRVRSDRKFMRSLQKPPEENIQITLESSRPSSDTPLV